MTYTVIWEKAAADGLKRLRQREGDKVKPLVQVINRLAANPEPPESSKLGGSGIRRLRIGRYRATYRVDGDRVAVQVLMVGSVPA